MVDRQEMVQFLRCMTRMDLRQGDLDHIGHFLKKDVPWEHVGMLAKAEGVAGLIAHELGTLVNKDEHQGSVFAPELQRQFEVRSEDLDARERRLAEREQSLKSSERLMRTRTRPLDLPDRARVGRNDPCPCGSGFKYKRCHGN